MAYLFSAMIEITCYVNQFFDLWQRCNFSEIEALEFSRVACDRRPISGRRLHAY